MSREPYTTRDMVSDDLAGIERDAIDISDVPEERKLIFAVTLVARGLAVLTRAVADVADAVRRDRDR